MEVNRTFILNLIIVFLAKGSRSESKFSVSARLMGCKEPESTVTNEDYGTFEVRSDLLNSYPSKSGVTGPRLVNECQRKLYIRIHINQNATVSGDDDYIVIDDVIDGTGDDLVQLLSPLIVKIHREQPQLIYPLEFEKIVNGGLSEDVIPIESNNQPNRAKGCDSSICGSDSHNDNKLNPMRGTSEGFCCSCKGSIHSGRKPSPVTNSRVTSRKSSHKDLMRKKRTARHHLKIKPKNSVKNVDKEFKGVMVLRKKFQKPPPIFFFENDRKVTERHRHDDKNEEEEEEDQYEANDERMGAKHLEGEAKLELLVAGNKNDIVDHENDIDTNMDVAIKSPNGDPDGERHSLKISKRSTHKSMKYQEGDPFRIRVNKERLNKVMAAREHVAYSKKVRRNCDDSVSMTDTAHCLKYSDLFYSVYTFKEPEIVQELSVQVFEKNTADDSSAYWVDLTRGKAIRLGSLFPRAKDKLPTISMAYSSIMENNRDDPNIFPLNPDAVVVLVPSHLRGNGSIETHPEAQGGPGEYLIVSKDEFSSDGTQCDRIGTSFDGFSKQPDRCDRPRGSCLTNQPIDLWIEDMRLKLSNQRGSYFLENYGTLPAMELSSLAYVQNDFLALEFNGDFECSVEIELQSNMNGLIKMGNNVELQSITTDASSSRYMKVEIMVINQGLVAGGFHPRVVDCEPDFASSPFADGPSILIAPLKRNLFRLWVEEDLPEAIVTCAVDILNAQRERVASRQMMIQKNRRCLCVFYCACQCVSSGEVTQPCTPLIKEEYSAAGYVGDIPYHPIVRTKLNFHIERSRLLLIALTCLLLFGKFKMLIGYKYEWIYYYGLTFIKGKECKCAVSLKQRIIDGLLDMFFFIIYPMKMILVCFLHLITCQCFPFCKEQEKAAYTSDGAWGSNSNLGGEPFVGYVNSSMSVNKLYYEDGDGLEVEDINYVLHTMEEFKY